MEKSISQIESAIDVFFDRETADALRPYAPQLLSRARSGCRQQAMEMEIARCHQAADINTTQPDAVAKLAALVIQQAASAKRPADTIGNAVQVMRMLTGEANDDTPPDDGKDPAAVSMGRRGGAARAASMTPERRAEIAKTAAAKRWGR